MRRNIWVRPLAFLIPVSGIRWRARIVGLTTRRTRAASLFVITSDVRADRSAGAQLRGLLGTRSAMHLCADRRQARACGHSLIPERLSTTINVDHAHCMPVRRRPLAAVVLAGHCQRRTQRRRRNQTGSGGEDQASGRSKSGEQHVDTAKCPTLFERVGGKLIPLNIADRSIVGASGMRHHFTTQPCRPVCHSIYCAARLESRQKVLGLPEGCNTMLLHAFWPLFEMLCSASV